MKINGINGIFFTNYFCVLHYTYLRLGCPNYLRITCPNPALKPSAPSIEGAVLEVIHQGLDNVPSTGEPEPQKKMPTNVGIR